MRLKFQLVLILTAALCVASPAFSQSDYKPLSHVSVGVKASTFGYGLEAATPLNKMLAFRAGINSLSVIKNVIKIGEFNYSLSDYQDDLDGYFTSMPNAIRVKPDINFTHGNLLLDFYPGGGIFHLTTGFFMGTSKIKATGSVVDSNNKRLDLLPDKEWPTVEIGGKDIRLASSNTLELQLGGAIKPYFGLGFGRAVPKKRVSFKFELGLIYQGNYSIKLNNTALNLNAYEEDVKDTNFEQYLKFWPMMNFQLSYRIF